MSVNMENDYEENMSARLESHFEPFIARCRLGDWEHAKRVVGWIERLGADHPKFNLMVMAGYVHDIGWSGLVPENRKLTRDELLRLQPRADKQTSCLVKEATKGLGLADEDMETVLRLVRATESYVATRDDEVIMVDADSLSKTAPEHITQKYEPSDWLGMCSLFEERLPPMVTTELGKKLLGPLLVELRCSLVEELEAGGNM